MNKRLTAMCLGMGLVTAAAWADDDVRGFSVDFAQCTEVVGVGPVDFARAAALVPSRFSTLAVGGTAAIVVRATSCGGVQVNGHAPVRTAISQIGVEIVPPDGTGDINNYTLVYVSNNAELIAAYNQAGVPAFFDANLTYQFTYDSTGKAGEIYVEADAPGLPAYFITGTETDPAAPYGDFKANWWFAGPKGVVKQAADFPNIAFGAAAVSLHTDRKSVIGALIGGNTDADFHYLPLRGVYSSAHMQVSVSGNSH